MGLSVQFHIYCIAVWLYIVIPQQLSKTCQRPFFNFFFGLIKE